MATTQYGPTRVCTDCKAEKPTEDFGYLNGKKNRARGTRRGRCTPCWLAHRAHTYQTKDKARMFKWRYGITIEERDAMFEAQGRRCAICRTDEHGGQDWCVDHDHSCCPKKSTSCGKCIRGILCFQCNVALGCVKDDPTTLQAMAEYVTQANVSRRVSAQ